MNINDLQYLVADENNEPYGQAYAFTVGSEFVGFFIVNLNTTETGEVLVIVVSTDNDSEVIFDAIVPDFSSGVVSALQFLAERPDDVLRMSEAAFE